MKIQKIECENFRTFKERISIPFSTDGKVTVIYGLNGCGKTTLHLLFQWILYDKNGFSDDILYNLSNASVLRIGDVFSVWGTIDFTHNEKCYTIKREYVYKKNSKNAPPVVAERKIELIEKDNEDNWKPIDNPSRAIESFLPLGLSDYFFFSGEDLIKDLQDKGVEQATRLKNAIYSMLGIDVYQQAIEDIGLEDLKRTAIGKLYTKKGELVSDSRTQQLFENIEKLGTVYENTQKAITEKVNQIQELKVENNKISELIGASKSTQEYEDQRKKLLNMQKQWIESIETQQVGFGKQLADEVVKYLMHKKKCASDRIQIKKNEDIKLPEGVNKPLVETLLKSSTCICGRELCRTQKEHIASFLDYLPPFTYEVMYSNSLNRSENELAGFKEDMLNTYLLEIIRAQDEISNIEEEIIKIDKLLTETKNIQEYVKKRQENEHELEMLDKMLINLRLEEQKISAYIRKNKKELDTALAGNKHNKLINRKINILQKVKECYKKMIGDSDERYSGILQAEITDLIKKMLTAERRVTVDGRFKLRVFDEHGNEAKSRGQLAVASFAYIGGILSMLSKSADEINKDYPLVLDGPFSDLDIVHSRNVILTIPEYAPQVIIFSKDDIHDVFENNHIGYEYMLRGNDQKNVSTVVPGYTKEYFDGYSNHE